LNLITQQLAILGQQIELKGNTTITAANQTIVPKVANGMVLPKSLAEVRTAEEIAEHAFGAAPRIEKANEMSYSQNEFLHKLIASYNKKLLISLLKKK
jgi:hypothetical protein